MKFKVRVSELRYGDVVVEAESEEAAKTIATGKEIDFFDSEITDMTVEPVLKNGYSRELLKEPFIWEPEDWTPEEWDTLCKVCGLPPDNTERIVLRASEVEYFLNLSQKLAHAGRTYLVTEVLSPLRERGRDALEHRYNGLQGALPCLRQAADALR